MIISRINVSAVRPSNTTAYSAGQTIASLTSSPVIDWKFQIGRRNGRCGNIVKAILQTDQTSNTSKFRLHLYNSAPTAIADGANCTVLFANAGSYQGFIDFPAAAQLGSSSDTSAQAMVVPPVTGQAAQATLPLSFQSDSAAGDVGGGNLYGLLEVVGAGFTPASGQKFNILLEADLSPP